MQLLTEMSPIGAKVFTRDAVLELSERAAELAPSSFNAERYTVDVIFSSGAGRRAQRLTGPVSRSLGDDQRRRRSVGIHRSAGARRP